MKCEKCGSALKSERVVRSYSPELPTVIVDGLEQTTCAEHGDSGVVYPRPSELSALVVGALLNKPGRLAPGEVTFLRGALGLKGKALAELFGVTAAQVSRWETGTMPISALADRLLRAIVASARGLPLPELRLIDARKSEPLTLRLELGRKGWRVVEPKRVVA